MSLNVVRLCILPNKYKKELFHNIKKILANTHPTVVTKTVHAKENKYYLTLVV